MVERQKSKKDGEKGKEENSMLDTKSILHSHDPHKGSVDVERELSRFKSKTGVDFFDLTENRTLRAKFLVDGIDNHETDDDETEAQRFFGTLQKNVAQSDKES